MDLHPNVQILPINVSRCRTPISLFPKLNVELPSDLRECGRASCSSILWASPAAMRPLPGFKEDL
jgi:hypothetical protein